MKLKQLAYAVSLIGFAGTLAPLAHAADEAAVKKVDKIEVTGSSIKRTAKEGALPVQSISKDDIAKSGVTNVQDLIQNISAFSTSGSTATASVAGTGTFGLSSPSLRGLGSNRTLVLVNGRRLAPAAGNDGSSIDMNAIPISAIERVEVLKDGASGVYGADAIAGVINFILSKSYRGFMVDGSYGTPSDEGGGSNSRADFVVGFGDLDADRFNVTLTGSMEKESRLWAKDRAYAKTALNEPYYSGSATGQGNIQGAWDEVNHKPTADYVKGTASAGYGNPAATKGCDSIGMFNAGKTKLGASAYCQFDSAGYVALIPQRELTNLVGNGVFKINEEWQAFGDFIYSKSKVFESYQNSPMRSSFFDTDSNFAALGVDKALLLRPTNPNYATAAAWLKANGFSSLVGQPLGITARSAGLGNREATSERTQTRQTIGVRGTIAGQDVELAASRNEAKLDYLITKGYFRQAVWVKVINDTNSWNPWAPDGLGNAALQDKLKAEAQYTGNAMSGTSKTNSVDFKATGELLQIAGNPLSYAAGAQYRKDNFILTPSDEYSSGAISGLGGSIVPMDKSREVKALFSELSLPIGSTIELNAALRSDRYDDVGNTNNYKVSARWQPSEMLVVRASNGTGFRAPTLTDLWYPQTEGTSAGFTDPATNSKNIQVTTKTGGNPGLKPEKSDQTSVGFVFQPTRTISGSVDLWKIKVKDIIATPSVQEVVSGFRAGKGIYQGLVTLDAKNNVTYVVNLTQNLGTADVRGADIDLTWADRFSFGRLSANLNGTYLDQFDQTFADGTISNKVGRVADDQGNPVLGGDNGGVNLKWKHRLTFNWSQGPWSAGVAQNFILHYGDAPDLDGNPHNVPSYSLFDLNVGYTGVKNLRLGLVVNNVMNKKPPVAIYPSQFANSFIYGYDFYNYNPRGRFISTTASYKFW
ncbi:TonB-dependent receptor [Burkholderiaceae bacterium DAT-1]|nr:TonB-dependent receptor [Burkholderiaceae bacterium DAT-1]